MTNLDFDLVPILESKINRQVFYFHVKSSNTTLEMKSFHNLPKKNNNTKILFLIKIQTKTQNTYMQYNTWSYPSRGVISKLAVTKSIGEAGV